MAEQKFKRNIAYKLRVGDIQMGKPEYNENKLQFLELGDKKIYRVNVAGNIVDKYHNDEKNFIFFTVDDGTGQMQVKAFGEDLIHDFKNLGHGETVVVIGVLRSWNDNLYISPEIMKKQDPKYLMVRKLEVENERDQEIKQQPATSSESQGQEAEEAPTEGGENQ
ncbi:MAG: OB-fold nucleic acid binding domain-containing protein, partial [Candidatus Pacearchaeota archaeon]